MRVWPEQRIIIGLLITLLVVGQFSFFNIVRDKFRQFVGLPARAANSLVVRTKNTVGVITAASRLAEENAGLHQQLNEREATIAKLRQVENENVTLRQDLRFAQTHPELRLVPAAVIGYSPISVDQSLTINVGTKNGLKEGQAVVSQGFLIGKIKHITDSTAEVWLLANRNLVTPVRLTGSQTTGILSGGIQGMVISDIPVDTKIETGELVVTSNLEGLYPAGIAIGSVQEIISRQEEIFQTVRINSPINVSGINQVFVAIQ